MVNGDPVDALAAIVHNKDAYHKGQRLITKLKDIIPRQLFDVAIQASSGGRIISRANVKALRKDVLAKCYGGDITRKKKLLEKQKKRQAPHEDGRQRGNSARGVYGGVEAGGGMKDFRKMLPGLLISLTLVAAILYFVDLRAVLEAFKKANYGLLLVVFLLGVAWLLVRGVSGGRYCASALRSAMCS